MNAVSAEVPVCAEIYAVIGSLRKPGLDGTWNQLLGKAIGVDFDLDSRGFSSKGFDRRGDWGSDRTGRYSDGRQRGEDGGELHFCWWCFWFGFQKWKWKLSGRCGSVWLEDCLRKLNCAVMVKKKFREVEFGLGFIDQT